MKALTTLLVRLTEPHPLILEAAERQRARLLSVILVLMGPLGLVSVLVLAWVTYTFLGVYDPLLFILELSIVLGILLTYRLSRTRHVSLAAGVLAGVLFAGIFAAIIQSPHYKTSAILLTLPLVLGSLILSLREAQIVALATAAGTLLLPVVGVNWETGDYITIIVTEIVFAAIVLLSAGLRERYSRQIEEQMRVLVMNERRFRALFEQVHDAVFLLDLQGNHLAVNRRAADMLGYTPDELKGLLVNETSGEIAESRRVLERLLSGEHVPPYERLFRKKTGEAFPVEINVELVRDAEGRPLHIQSVIRDITERKQAEANLQQRLDELSAFYANTSDLIRLRDLQEQLQVIVERATRLLDTTSGGLYLCDPETEQVRCVVSYNTLRDYTGTTLRYGEGAAGKVAQTGEPLIIEDYSVWPGRAAAYEEEKLFLSLLSVPLIWDQQVIGVIHALHASQRAYFAEDHLKLLTVFAQQAALAVANARLVENLKEERARAQANLAMSERRAAELSEVLIALAALDFEKRAKIYGTNDVFDALATGVNMLGEELSATTQALHDHHERLNFILSSSPAVIYTASLEEHLPATYYSENVYEQTGFTPGQFISDPDFWFDHVHPDDRELLLAQTSNFIQNGRQVFEYRFRFADGAYHWMRDSARLIRAPEGEPREMIGSWIEITERKRAEDDLRATQERLSHLIQNLPIVIYVAEAEGDYAVTYMSENGYALTGFTPENFIKRPSLYIERIHPEDAPRVLEALSRELGRHNMEYRWQVADGSYKWFHEAMQYIPASRVEPSRIIGIWEDITQRKLAEQELRAARDAAEQASRAKSEFLSIMSHELRTPLNGILGFTQLLELDAQSLPERVVRRAQLIHENSRKLLEMIEELLDYARADAGRLALELQPVEAAALVGQVCAELRPAAEAKRIQLQAEAPAHAPPVSADAVRLRQALRILVENAVKFTPEEGAVRVAVQQQAAGDAGRAVLRFAVRDTGIGISPELMPRLFQPLTQLDSSASRKHAGLGLGLALARRLIELQGGRIWAESAGEEQGSAFFFEINLEVSRYA